MNFRARFNRRRGAPLLDLGTFANGAPLALPFDDFSHHGLVVGPTGSGKTRFLQRFNLEVAEKHPEACIVVISPKGAFAPNLRRECYRRGWRRRVTYIDFSERRRLPGLNVIRPWGDDAIQAKVQREILTRSMGITDLSETPRLARYTFAGLFAAIAARLTLAEVPHLFDLADGGIRQAVIDRLSDGAARSDLQMLELMSQRVGQSGAARFFEEQVGSTLNRFRLMTESPALRLMLGSERSRSWDDLLAPGQIVAINADQGKFLDREDQRYLVMSDIADIARTCFSRSPDRAVRVSLTVDELGLFQNPLLTDILDRGREFGLSLLGATQYLTQLIDPKTGDRRLLDSFLTDTLVKVVFGGSPPGDAHELAALMYEHHLDPDKRQFELFASRQLHEVVQAQSTSRVLSRTRSRNLTHTHVWGEGDSVTVSKSHSTGAARGLSHTVQAGVGGGEGEFVATMTPAPSLLSGVPGAIAAPDAPATTQGKSTIDNAYSAESDTASETETDIDTVGIARTHTEQDVRGKARGVAVAKGIAEGVTEGPMVQPTAPYQELSSVTIEPLATQLHRFFADLVKQPRQHAMIATGKEPPVPFRVADVPDPVFTERQALVLDLDMMDAHNFFQTAEEIEHDIAARRRALVSRVEIVAVDTESAIARRRRARRNPADEEVA